MFKLNENTGNEYFSAGVNEKVLLTNVLYEPAKKDGTGDKVLRFYFMNEFGGEFTHTEFQNKPELISKWRNMTPARVKATVERMNNSLAARIMHILSNFVDIHTVNIEAETYEQMAQSYISVLGDSYKDVPVDLLLVYNKKNMLEIPKTSPKEIPFMVRHDVAEQHPELALKLHKGLRFEKYPIDELPKAGSFKASQNNAFSDTAFSGETPNSEDNLTF